MTDYIVDGNPNFYSTNIKYLDWTTEPPTQEGWYWVWSGEVKFPPQIAWVYHTKTKGYRMWIGGEYDPWDIPLEWKFLGPLPVPEVPKAD
jgi:hypothetical protein